MTLQERIRGGLWGSLVGDALGVPVEFQSREARNRDPVTGMRAYGTHGQPAGTWSDDGSLLLCSVESLNRGGFDAQDMGERFLRWSDLGHWAAHGLVFDIGIATRSALDRISLGTPAEQAGGNGLYDNGNGSLMRILPVVLRSLSETTDRFCDTIGRASAITHRHPRSQLACVYFGLVVRGITSGLLPEAAINASAAAFTEFYSEHAELPAFRDLLRGELASFPRDEIRSGGYVMETLTASLWCLLTTKTFQDCVLAAVNLGSDTDTTGCVAGGLAGVYYGYDNIPLPWLEVLPRQGDLHTLFDTFIADP